DILNTLGQVVLNGNVVEKTRVQTSQLAPGVYFVKIEKEKSIIVKRLIKE
ncbi:MAG: T9SS type A sorting domain-containing protein, partial [Bacteroidales bacterium]|nr:T9SS type A sorting domain-containing protein [Bacteroidales bacterium]MCF8458756.1 T9SS type A sorting domain-containing protein [Bacteroidales bacterium]